MDGLILRLCLCVQPNELPSGATGTETVFDKGYKPAISVHTPMLKVGNFL